MQEHKADKLLGFSLLLFAGTCILSITLAEAALALMSIAILWKAFASPEGFRQPLSELHDNPLVFPLAVYLLVYMFSSVFSLDPARSWGRLDTEIIKALSAILVFSAVSRAGREKAALWFVAGASAAALLGLGQFIYGFTKPILQDLPRAYGTMHAVTHAEVLALAMVLSAIMAAETSGNRKKIFMFSYFITTLGFAASFSRGPAIGAFFSLAVIFFIRRDTRKLALAGLALTLLFFAAGAAANRTNREKIISVTGYLSKAQSAEKLDYASNVRLTMWKAGTNIFKDYPLTGTGPYALRKVFNNYHGRPIDKIIDYPDVHNLYLQRAADMGIPGLIALLLLFGAILKSSVVSFLRRRDAYGLWGMAAFSGFMLMMATDSSFDLPRVAFCIYLLAAMSATLPSSEPADK